VGKTAKKTLIFTNKSLLTWLLIFAIED